MLQLNGLKVSPKIRNMEGAKNHPQYHRTQWKQWAACISGVCLENLISRIR